MDHAELLREKIALFREQLGSGIRDTTMMAIFQRAIECMESCVAELESAKQQS